MYVGLSISTSPFPLNTRFAARSPRLFFCPFSKRCHLFRFKTRASSSSPPPPSRPSVRNSRRRVYRQSPQAPSSLRIPSKEITSVVAPAGIFFASTFVLWKLVEKLLVSEQNGPSVESKSSGDWLKWLFAAGTNLSSGASVKLERESRQRLNDFAKELRSFRSIDMSDALKENRTLTILDLAGNNICEKGGTAIAQVLKDNSVIKSLRVKGAEYIADLLKYNTTISTLDLRGNGLGDDGVMLLAGSLKIVTETLSSLDLAFNEIRDDGVCALAEALKSNEEPALTSLNLANNLFTKLGQVALTDARDHVYEITEKEIAIFF